MAFDRGNEGLGKQNSLICSRSHLISAYTRIINWMSAEFAFVSKIATNAPIGNMYHVLNFDCS